MILRRNSNNMSDFQQGLSVTLVGMVVVFLFLLILVMSMNVAFRTIKYLNKVFPEKTQKAAVKRQSFEEEEIAVAIAAAKVFAGEQT